jgi:hypothetical protein
VHEPLAEALELAQPQLVADRSDGVTVAAVSLARDARRVGEHAESELRFPGEAIAVAEPPAPLLLAVDEYLGLPVTLFEG